MGIEVPKKFGGCEFSFMSSIIVVEGNKLFVYIFIHTCPQYT
jgi:hypothetical protein